MEEMTKEQIKSKRTVSLILSSLVLLFLGLIYAFSMFAKPMVQDFAALESVGSTFFIMMIAFCTGCVAGSFIDKKVGTKVSLIISAVMVAIGFIGTGMLCGTGGLGVMYGFYAIIGGLGVGYGYNTIVATTNGWFPDKVGFSGGVMMMCFGLSSLIMGTLFLNLRGILGGMGGVLIAIGVIVAVLVIALAFLLTRAPKNCVAVMAPEKLQAGGVEIGEDDAVLKSSIFYVYYIWGIIIIAVGLAVIGNCAADATTLGINEGFASLLVGLVSTCNGLARLVLGALFDRTNIKVTMLVDGIIATVGVACICGAFGTGASMLFIVGALCVGFAYGGVPIMASSFARARFGAKNYPVNLSIVNFAICFGALLNMGVAAFAAGNRMTVFVCMLIFAIIAVLDVFVFSKMWKKQVEDVMAAAK